MNSHVDARRARAAAAWNLKDEIVLVASGDPIGIPGGADQTYPFVAHSEYHWLTEIDMPGGVVAFDAGEGWIDFVPQVTDRQRLWEGTEQPPGRSLAELAAWLGARRARPVIVLGAGLPGVVSDPARTSELRELIHHARRVKDESEIERMRKAAAASAAGYAKLVSLMRPGITERALQIEMEAEFFRGGADHTGYESIVASGPRSAILHAPATERKLADGELLLIDAGAAVRRYVIDITRTYAVNGKLSGLQKDLYDVVLKAEENAIRASQVGTWWHEVHLGASREMVAGLVALGIMRGDPASLVEQEAHTLFFPHGLGHMVGLGVRDASGRLPGDRREVPPMLSTLRTDMPLEPGYALTIEPGIYFVPPLLKNPEKRARYKDAVNWSKVDTLMDFGGIRIEDNVIIRKEGPENLTQAVPK